MPAVDRICCRPLLRDYSCVFQNLRNPFQPGYLSVRKESVRMDGLWHFTVMRSHLDCIHRGPGRAMHILPMGRYQSTMLIVCMCNLILTIGL